MSDDSYFGDDIVLDDDVLAALDAEEQKHLITQPQATKQTFVRHTPPPPKKQKTYHQWNSRPATLHGTDSLDEYGDLPEISVQGDGTYEVSAAASTLRDAAINLNTRTFPSPSSALSKPGPADPFAAYSSRRPTSNLSQRPPVQPIQPQVSYNQQAFPIPSQGRVEQRTELSDLRDRVENVRVFLVYFLVGLGCPHNSCHAE